MNFPLYIAKRYLFSKTSTNAINIITIIASFGVIVGSSAILKDKEFIYAYGVTEPSSHEVYLLRFPIDEIVEGYIAGLEWWNEDSWTTRKEKNPAPSPLFIGQTEFSVHYQENLHQYVRG